MKKRKLIEFEQNVGVMCDNPNCDYQEEITPKNQKASFINTPCPKCGENLLTEEDFIRHEKLIKSVNWINKYFSWITVFFKESTEYHSKIVHVHNGVHTYDSEEEFIESRKKSN